MAYIQSPSCPRPCQQTSEPTRQRHKEKGLGSCHLMPLKFLQQRHRDCSAEYPLQSKLLKTKSNARDIKTAYHPRAYAFENVSRPSQSPPPYASDKGKRIFEVNVGTIKVFTTTDLHMRQHWDEPRFKNNREKWRSVVQQARGLGIGNKNPKPSASIRWSAVFHVKTPS